MSAKSSQPNYLAVARAFVDIGSSMELRAVIDARKGLDCRRVDEGSDVRGRDMLTCEVSLFGPTTVAERKKSRLRLTFSLPLGSPLFASVRGDLPKVIVADEEAVVLQQLQSGIDSLRFRLLTTAPLTELVGDLQQKCGALTQSALTQWRPGEVANGFMLESHQLTGPSKVPIGKQRDTLAQLLSRKEIKHLLAFANAE